MRYFKKIFPVMIIIFMIYCLMSMRQVDRVFVKWLTKEKPQYQGYINIWHIEDYFDVDLPYAKILKKYEKNNFGIFINVTKLTKDEALKMIEQGKKPDIITYSKNIFENPKEVFLPLDKVKIPMIKAGEYDGDILAYPICYDTYSVLFNEDMLYEKEVDFPTVMQPDFIFGKASDFGVLFNDSGAVLNLFDSYNNCITVKESYGSLKDFADSKSAVYVGSKLDTLKSGYEMPSNSEYDFSGLTDKVRYVSVLENEKNKTIYAKEIAKLLTEKNAQQQISKHAFTFEFGYNDVKAPIEPQVLKVFYNDIDVKLAFDHKKEKELKEKIKEIMIVHK